MTDKKQALTRDRDDLDDLALALALDDLNQALDQILTRGLDDLDRALALNRALDDLALARDDLALALDDLDRARDELARARHELNRARALARDELDRAFARGAHDITHIPDATTENTVDPEWWPFHITSEGGGFGRFRWFNGDDRVCGKYWWDDTPSLAGSVSPVRADAVKGAQGRLL